MYKFFHPLKRFLSGFPKRLLFAGLLLALSMQVFSQYPVITVRFANPQLNCNSLTYCVDVEFNSNTPDLRLFGMNVRYFFDSSVLTFQNFTDFPPGYGPFSPNPPIVATGLPSSGPTLFGLNGAATYVNGAIQLIDPNTPPVYISTTGWTKLFKICFTVKNVELFASGIFAPSLIWDLEENPINGGFLPGSDGVVITVVAPPPMQSAPTTENVVQFNWQYSSSNPLPFGYPAVTHAIPPCFILMANNDDFTANPVSSFEGGIAGNVLLNDLVNGYQPLPGQVTLAIINHGGIPGAQLTYDGNLLIPPVTPAGLYSMTYRLSEYGNNDNYKDATISLSVADPQLSCPGTLIVCADQAPFVPASVSPSGGTFSGNGIINGVFHPGIAGAGLHFISYCITNPFSGQVNCCEFTIRVSDGQQVSISAGWSGISSYIVPDNPAMNVVLGPVEESVKIVTDLQGIYWPDMGVTTLNQWNSYKGYIVRAINSTILPMCGNSIAYTSLLLPQGWNLMPVLSEIPYNADNLFGNLSTLVVAKEIAGTGIYWPAYNINTIGNLLPGRSYLVRVNAPTTIDFSIPQKNSSTIQPENILALNTPWNVVTFTPSSHLVVFRLSDHQLREGDIIGAFTSDGLCAGLTEFKTPGQNFAMAIYGDDTYSPETDGFLYGDRLTFQLYRPSTGEIFDLKVTYNPDLNTGYFETNALSEVNSMVLIPTGIIILDSESLKVYPNPTSGLFTIDGIAGETTVIIYDAFGKKVLEKQSVLPASFDITGASKGIYLIRLQSGKMQYFRKLLLH